MPSKLRPDDARSRSCAAPFSTARIQASTSLRSLTTGCCDSGLPVSRWRRRPRREGSQRQWLLRQSGWRSVAGRRSACIWTEPATGNSVPCRARATGARCWAGPMRTPWSSPQSLTWSGSIPAMGRIPSSTQRPSDASRWPWTTLASPTTNGCARPCLVKPGCQPRLRAARVGAPRPHTAALVVARPGRVARRPSGSAPWNGGDRRWHLWHRSRVRAQHSVNRACSLQAASVSARHTASLSAATVDQLGHITIGRSSEVLCGPLRSERARTDVKTSKRRARCGRERRRSTCRCGSSGRGAGRARGGAQKPGLSLGGPRGSR